MARRGALRKSAKQHRRLFPPAHWLRLGMLMAIVSLVTLWTARRILPTGSAEKGALNQNLALYLSARHGLHIQPQDIFFPKDQGAPGSLSPREVYFLGRIPGNTEKDLYFSHVILSEESIVVHASPAFSLSKTSAADEEELHFDGRTYLAYASVVNGKSSVVTILDLQGLSARAMAGFSPVQRFLQRLTNWQDTGRWRGLDRLEVKLNLSRPVSLSWDKGLLYLKGKIGTWQVVVNPRQVKVLEGPAQVRRVQIGKRSFLPWAVDTVRNFSFVGPDKIAWLEELVYGVVDRARRMSGAEVTAFDIKDEMDLPVVRSPASHQVEGWPPPPLRPILSGPLKGEGKWVEVEGPFLRREAGLPSAFAMTFVRPDRERLFARAFFVAWDPRRVELHMVGGTAEPRSATGELGRGIIPRQEALLQRLVAAFNGGFQSMHGDFGMMEERKIYCPPQPWAATVARLADGSTGFGTWDGNAPHNWVPDYILSFRQNLTPMVEDAVFNPWRRGSWGGGAGFLTGSGPKAFIIRSGLCLHQSGHVMYVLGDPMDGPTLGKTMQRVGCTYAMELDINRGHVGFEFYNVRGAKEPDPQDAARFTPVRYFSRKGEVQGANQMRYFMREVIKGTGNSPVPRYLGREARDFFYLVLRKPLGGADLDAMSQQPNEGHWTTAALPEPALRFPQSMIRTFLAPDHEQPALRVRLVKMDLRWLESTLCLPSAEMGCMPEPGARPSPLAIMPLGGFSDQRVVLAEGKVLAGAPTAAPASYLILRPQRPAGPALPQLSQQPSSLPGSISIQSAEVEAIVPPTGASTASAPRPRAACCVDAEGMMFYASGIGVDRHHLKAALTRAGCTEVIHLGASEPLLLAKQGSYESLFGAVFPPVASSPSLVFYRSKAPWAPRIFTHVKPLPRSVWTLAQPERTRASALRHAKKAVEALGLPPIKSLHELCRPPYSEQKELRRFRWRDPRTGKVCGTPSDTGTPTRRSGTPTHRSGRRKGNHLRRDQNVDQDRAGSASAIHNTDHAHTPPVPHRRQASSTAKKDVGAKIKKEKKRKRRDTLKRVKQKKINVFKRKKKAPDKTQPPAAVKNSR